MRNPFYKPLLTKKEKREVMAYQRNGNTRTVLSILLFFCVFFLFHLNFEVKLIDLLSKTSMVDKTATLDLFDKRALKKSIDYIYKKHGLALVYEIGYEDLELPKFNVPTIYISINPLLKDVLAYVPSTMPRASIVPDDVMRAAQISLEDDLKICLFDDALPIDTQNTYTYRAPIHFNKNLAPCFIQSLEKLVQDFGG